MKCLWTLCLFGVLFPQALPGAEIQKEKIFSVVKGFFQGLKEKDLGRVKQNLSAQIAIQAYSRKDIKEKVDDLIFNRISAVDYLQVISGLNIYKFLNQHENKTWTILKAPVFINEVYQDQTVHGGQVQPYYFVKLKVEIKELGEKQVLMTKAGEVDVLVQGNRYTIFGFII